MVVLVCVCVCVRVCVCGCECACALKSITVLSIMMQVLSTEDLGRRISLSDSEGENVATTLWFFILLKVKHTGVRVFPLDAIAGLLKDTKNIGVDPQFCLTAFWQSSEPRIHPDVPCSLESNKYTKKTCFSTSTQSFNVAETAA